MSRHQQRAAAAARTAGKNAARRHARGQQITAPDPMTGPLLARKAATAWHAGFAEETARHASEAKALSGYTGLKPRSGMISLDLPPGTVTPLPGGVDDHHVTVVYLGPDVDDEAWETANQRAAEAAAMVPGPLHATLDGIGSFPPDEEGRRPVFIPASIPGGDHLRNHLADLSASQHRDWKPHVTLAMTDPADPMPEPQPRRQVTFTHLAVHRGDEVRRHLLGPDTTKGAPMHGILETKVGPKGYVHGWHYVGIPGLHQEVHHPSHGRGIITAVHGNNVTVRFHGSGAERTYEHVAPKPGAKTGFAKRAEHEAGTAATAHHVRVTSTLYPDHHTYHTVPTAAERDALIGGARHNRDIIAEGEKFDTSRLPAEARALHEHAVAHGWRASIHESEGRGGRGPVRVHQVNLERGTGDRTERISHVWANGKHDDSRGPSVAESTARISTPGHDTKPGTPAGRDPAAPYGAGQPTVHTPEQAAALAAGDKITADAVAKAARIHEADKAGGGGHLPPLVALSTMKHPDGTTAVRAVDHQGRKYSISNDSEGRVHVMHAGELASAPAGTSMTQTARERAGKLTGTAQPPATAVPATPARQEAPASIPGAWHPLTRAEAGERKPAGKVAASAIDQAAGKLHAQGKISAAQHGHLLKARDAFEAGDHGNAADHLRQASILSGERTDGKAARWIHDLFQHADNARANRKIVSYGFGTGERTVTQPPAQLAMGQRDTRPVVSDAGRLLTSNRLEVNDHLDNAAAALRKGDQQAAASHLAAASFAGTAPAGTNEAGIADRARAQSDTLAARSPLPRTPDASQVVGSGVHEGVRWTATEKRDELGNGLERTYTLTHPVDGHVREVPAYSGPHSAAMTFLENHRTLASAPLTGNAAHAAEARRIADGVRLERGLSKGQRDEAERRLYTAARHLDSGQHADAMAELDETAHLAGLPGGGVIKGSTAAQARELSGKIRAANPGLAPAAGEKRPDDFWAEQTGHAEPEPPKPAPKPSWQQGGMFAEPDRLGTAPMFGDQFGTSDITKPNADAAGSNAGNTAPAARKAPAAPVKWEHSVTYTGGTHFTTVNGHHVTVSYGKDGGPFRASVGTQPAGQSSDLATARQMGIAHALSLPPAPPRPAREKTPGELHSAELGTLIGKVGREADQTDRDETWKAHDALIMARQHVDEGQPEQAAAALANITGTAHSAEIRDLRTRIQMTNAHGPQDNPDTPWLGSLPKGDNAEYRKIGGNTIAVSRRPGGTGYQAHVNGHLVANHEDLTKLRRTAERTAAKAPAREVKALASAITSSTGREDLVRKHLTDAEAAIDDGNVAHARAALDMARRTALGEFGARPEQPVLITGRMEAARAITMLSNTLPASLS